jgi:5-deoxy-glucuronate isomerase
MTEISLIRRPRQQSTGSVVSITPSEAGWSYVHFQAYRFTTRTTLSGETGDRETALIVLEGRCDVKVAGERFAGLGDRASVWQKRPPYTLLLPPNVTYQVDAREGLQLAVAAAPADATGPIRVITPADIASEERGQGQTYRLIQHILPSTAPASRLLLVEVYTPGGNWSSFPPHKHDTDDPPRESYLEEIYYYQIQPARGFALQRIYTADGSLDQTVVPGNGDLVLVPRGYHPVAATPGHDCYYLNVMAGPTRAWNFQVDPNYASLMNWQKSQG